MAERIIKGILPTDNIIPVYVGLYKQLETLPPSDQKYKTLLNLLEGLKAKATENNIPIEVNVGEEVSNLLQSIGLL